MTSTKKTYKLGKIKQLIDLNGDSTNFNIQFKVTSKNGEPFDIVVVDQTTLDNSPELEYRKANGQMSGNMIQDKNVYQNYFIVLKSDQECECDVEIVKKELPKTMNDHPNLQPPRINAESKLNEKQTNWKTWAIVGIVIIGGIVLYMIWNSDKKKTASDGIEDQQPIENYVQSSPDNSVVNSVHSSPAKSDYSDSNYDSSNYGSPYNGNANSSNNDNGLLDRLKRLHMN